ncbi:MAG TPA: lytic transglycosylase domain-containing protein [Bryobacteraceae bacterium]|nr:lytic transglycosylase domain-containing protein [Bryobacteraceae bacterium]
MKRALLFLSLVYPALGGEYAVLQNGFRIYADRHETVDGSVRLHIGSGSMDMPAADVVRFDADEYVKLPEAPPAAVPTETAGGSVAVAGPLAPPDPKELIQRAATTHGLRPEFVRSVAAVESAWRTQAVSPKGAIGLMQLMPGTARDLGANPHNPAENADAGTRYLRMLLERYANSPDPVRLALAAYNAGPGAVDRYRNIPPYRETQAYVEKVLRKYLAELKPKSAS